MNRYAALMAHEMGHPIAFHVDAINEVENYDQVSREGIWWLPRDSVQDQLVLSNQGKYALELQLLIYDSQGRQAATALDLGPRQTGRYSVRELLKGTSLTGDFGGVKIIANAHAGSLDTLHILVDETQGFSANLKMFDRDPKSDIKSRDFAQTSAWTLHAPMLALTEPDPALGFPAGTELHPLLFVRNTTSHAVASALQFNWRNASNTGKATGPAIALGPYQTTSIDVSQLQNQGLLPKDAHWTSVTLKTSAQPDDLMAVAASYDTTFRYGAQTPFSDQLTYRWEGGAWEVDNNHDSIITAGNGGTKPLKANFTIYYNRGQNKYELEQDLQPDDQMWIDVGDLIRRQVPDKTGKPLPVTLTAGSYQFNDLTNRATGKLFEGKVIYDHTFGHVSYGCASCCAYIGSPWFNPSPLNVSVYGYTDGDVLANDGCDSGVGSVVDGFVNWSSSNTAVATVTPSFPRVTGVAVGSISQSSTGSMTIWRSRF